MLEVGEGHVLIPKIPQSHCAVNWATNEHIFDEWVEFHTCDPPVMGLELTGHLRSTWPCVVQSQGWILAPNEHKVAGRIHASWGLIIGHYWLLYQECLFDVDQLDSMVIATSNKGIRIQPGNNISRVHLNRLGWLKTRNFSLLPLIWRLNAKISQWLLINFPKLNWSKLIVFSSLELIRAWSKDIWSEWILWKTVPTIHCFSHLLRGLC